MSELAAIAITIARPGCEEPLAKALEALIEPTRREAGHLQYDMHRDLRDPRCFVFIERWESEETFQAHVDSPHVADYLRMAAPWVERSEVRALAKVR